MNNRIELSKKDVLDILDIVKNKNKRLFRFLPRDLENDKNPRDYMTKIGIDYDDAIKIIKNLEFDNFYECILDIKNNFKYLYVFKKYIGDSKTYIKIAFLYDIKYDCVYVVSFHEDILEE